MREDRNPPIDRPVTYDPTRGNIVDGSGKVIAIMMGWSRDKDGLVKERAEFIVRRINNYNNSIHVSYD